MSTEGRMSYKIKMLMFRQTDLMFFLNIFFFFTYVPMFYHLYIQTPLFFPANPNKAGGRKKIFHSSVFHCPLLLFFNLRTSCLGHLWLIRISIYTYTYMHCHFNTEQIPVKESAYSKYTEMLLLRYNWHLYFLYSYTHSLSRTMTNYVISLGTQKKITFNNFLCGPPARWSGAVSGQ